MKKTLGDLVPAWVGGTYAQPAEPRADPLSAETLGALAVVAIATTAMETKAKAKTKAKTKTKKSTEQQEEAMANRYPVYWSESGVEHLRADGVRVRISLEVKISDKLERRLGWAVALPVEIAGNTISRYIEHFLPADRYPTVGSVLKKVDQTWEPPGHLKDTMSPSWLGHELEQLAREAPSMAHSSSAEAGPEDFPGSDYE